MIVQYQTFLRFWNILTTILIHRINVDTVIKFSLQNLKELEEKISKFHEREDTILYASCFDANAGLFEQLVGPEDAVISDALNHASIIDGIRLCKAKKYRYANKDMSGNIAKIITLYFKEMSDWLIKNGINR